MLRKKKKAPETVQETVLSDRLTFLDVIVEACQRTGRYTLIAESGDETYTVMIDRGGPFNVEGGGSAGSPALVKAATLRRGTYSVLEGWPVDQPVYQLGLDGTLQGLVLGTKPEERQLPPARGVDAMRNQDWQKAVIGPRAGNGKEPDPFGGTTAGGASPDPFGKSARNGGGLHPIVQPAGPFVQAAGPWLVTGTSAPAETPTQFEAPAAHAAAPAISMPAVEGAPIGTLVEEPAVTPAPVVGSAVAEASVAPVESVEARADAIEAPIEAPLDTIDAPADAPAFPSESVAVALTADVQDAAAVATAVEPQDTISYLREMARAAKVDPEDEAPTAPKQQGRIKRRVMQFLLWTVEVEDEPEHYTLGQVLNLVLRSMGSAFTLIVRPLTGPFVSRFHRTKEDWRISGEVVSRQKARRNKPADKPGKLRR